MKICGGHLLTLKEINRKGNKLDRNWWYYRQENRERKRC